MTKDVFFTFQATVCLKGRNQLRPSGRMRAGCVWTSQEENKGGKINEENLIAKSRNLLLLLLLHPALSGF